jgi:hypothetical protein
MNTTCTCEESTANPSDSAETIFWLKLTMTSVLMLLLIPCIFIDIQERLTSRRRKAMILPALKKLKADYANMSSAQRGKVETCKTKIMTVLGPISLEGTNTSMRGDNGVEKGIPGQERQGLCSRVRGSEIVCI